MRKLLCPVLIGLLAVSIANAAPVTKQPAVVGDLISQVRQYAAIKTIHFQAVGHYKLTLHGKATDFTERYKYWGSGTEFRISFQQNRPGASFDVLITDNGHHFRYFDRLVGQLRIMQSHPTHGETPDMRNPILEPLIFLIPEKARSHWLNLARFTRNPRSVLRRCLAVKNCARAGQRSEDLRGCVSGSLARKPTRFTFGISTGKHAFVEGVVALQRKGGSYLHIYGIKYHNFRTPSGRVLRLPTSFAEKGRQGAANVSVAMAISRIVIDRPIPPGKFTIDYKLARVVVDETGRGKPKYIPIQPTRYHIR